MGVVLALQRRQPTALEHLASVARLTQNDAIGSLFDLDSKIIGKKAKITHLELHLHLLLERHNVVPAGTGDDQVVDVDANDQPAAASAARVDTMLSAAPLETKGH